MYLINGKKYEMKELTLGQVEQLIKLFKGVNLTFEDMTSFMLELGSKISDFLAIILVPDGGSPDAGYEERVKDMKTLSDFDTLERIVNDFFGEKGGSSQLKKILDIVIKAINEKMAKTTA